MFAYTWPLALVPGALAVVLGVPLWRRLAMFLSVALWRYR